MSASFDNLVARKGSPTHSLRSGSTNASASNMSETRDLSRQSAQQARHNHRRAIQARKVVFLVLILLLILGGLSYAIYRVVSNDSEETESTEIKLEENDKTSIHIKTSSVFIDELKTSTIHGTTKTLIFSRKKEQLISTISTLKQAPQPEQKTSSILKAQETQSLQSTIEHTSSHVAAKNAPSSSAVSSEAPAVETTMIIGNIVKTTTNVVPTSNMFAHSSHENMNKPTKSPSLQLQITKSSLYQNMETPSLHTSKSSLVSNLDSHTADNIPETQTTQSSIIKMKQVSPSTTILTNLQSTETNIPLLPKDKTATSGMTIGSTVFATTEISDQNPLSATNTMSSKASDLVHNPPSTKTREQMSFPTIILIKPSTSATSISSIPVSNLIHISLTTEAQEQTPSSIIAMDSTTSSLHPHSTLVSTAFPESTNIFHTQPSSVQTLSSSSAVPMDNNIIPPSSSIVLSEIGQIHSTATTKIQSSASVVENTPKLNNSAVVNSILTSVLPSVSPTRNVATPLNTSQIAGHLDNNISRSVQLTPTMSESSTNASINLDASDMTTATIQPTKTFITPVASSSVWVLPYYHSWGNWSTCSRDCGGGHTYQTRNCSQHGQCDDLGPSINATICNFHKCNETTFDVSVNLTDFEWTDDFYNTSSQAYMDLVEQLMEQLRAIYGPNVSIEIDNISQGSVIVSFIITFSSSSHISNLTNAINEGKIGNLSVSLVKIVNNMVPQEADFILVQNTTTNSTIIHWRSIQPNETNGILLGYKVTLTPGSLNWTLDDEEATVVKVVNLNPDTEYTISVLGFNINGDGEKKSATFKTKELPPYFLPWSDWSNCSRDCGGGVTSRSRSCSKEDMCSHLGELQQKENCNVEKCNETSYEVGLNMTNVDWTDDLYNTSSKAYQELLAKFLEELRKKYPNATFEIGTITKGSVMFNFKITLPKETETDVESFSDDLEENGLGNYTTEVNTIEDVNLPRVPPGSINVTMVTHHSAVINWYPISDEDSNGAIIGYKIILMPGHNKTVELNITARASDTEFSYVLQTLAPNTTYRFYVYGYNINGDGPESEIFFFTTKVQIPKIVSANISDITTTHALFSWQRINDNNETYGVIAGYKIFITHNNQPRIDLEVSSFESEVHLNDLLPNTSYGVIVFGYNHYGDGVISDMFNFTTRVQIPKVLPGNISQITRTSSVFSWNKIPDSEESYGKISGYKIFIICEDQHFSNMTVSQNESEIELRDLHSGTSYNVTIVGFNSYGEGLVSDIIGFRTRDLIPKPNSVAVTNITLTTAKLSWELIPPSEETYGNIDGYKIIVRYGSVVNTTTVRDMASTVLRNISSNSSYCFHVLAFNVFGDGLQSDENCFTTLVEIQIDELKTSAVVILKPSQSHASTAHSPHTTEKLVITVYSQNNTRIKEMKKSSSVLRNNSVLHTKANSATISAMSTVGNMTTTTILMEHNDTQISSYTPTSSYTPSSTFTPSAFTSAVRPSSTTKETSIQNSPTIVPSTKRSSPPTTTSTPESSTASTKPSTPKTTSPPTSPTSPPPEVDYIVGKIRLTGETFNSELNDPESEAYKTLAGKLEKLLVDLFSAEGLQLESVKVLGFSQGSVIFDFYVTTLKSMEYQTDNFTVVLLQAVNNGTGLEGQPFAFTVNDFSTMQTKPTIPSIANEADKGLQKNDEDDDNALIVAVVLCILLVLGVALVVLYIGKKKNWFKRGKRKVVPEDDEDDDDDDLYPSPAQDTVRLKTARGGRKSHGARINGGQSTTEC